MKRQDTRLETWLADLAWHRGQARSHDLAWHGMDDMAWHAMPHHAMLVRDCVGKNTKKQPALVPIFAADPGGHRRRGGGAVGGRPDPHVPKVC